MDGYKMASMIKLGLFCKPPPNHEKIVFRPSLLLEFQVKKTLFNV